jgi:hypothetical protein
VYDEEGPVMAETQTQTKDAKIYTIVMAIWMVLLLFFGLLTLLGVFH